LKNPDTTSQRSSKLEVAQLSVFITLFLIAAKLTVGLLTDSLAILGQAADSAFDLIALLVMLFAVRISAEPPDEDHPYGHGKFESVSALLQGILLLAVTLWITVEAVGRLSGRRTYEVEVSWWSFGVLIVSILLDLWRAMKLRHAAKEHKSQALEASAVNFLTDILSAVAAIVSLALVRFGNMPEADAWAALLLAGFVGYLSIRLSKRAIDGLTDRFASSEEYKRLRNEVDSVPGVEGVRRLRVRPVGSIHFVDVAVSLSRVLPIGAIQSIIQEVEKCVRSIFPDSDITVDWSPIKTESESPFETLKLVAADHGVLPHNVELSQNEAGELMLDYHLEFPPKTDLVTAHDLSEEIERDFRMQMPQVGAITVHLEEERSDQVPQVVSDITAHREPLVREIEFYAKAANRLVKGVESISLVESAENRQLKLVLALYLDPKLSLLEAHDIVTNVEDELKKRFPEIERIVIHASPDLS
jgi:cation diffusion facilitator family transporter